METSPTILRALNSASNLGRRQKCPGSAHAEKGLPKLETEWSIEGSILHHHDAFPEEDQSKLTSEQREVLVRNKALRDKFLDATLQRLGIPADAECKILIEQELVLCDKDGELVMSHGEACPGHPDHARWYPQYRVMIVMDSKFGRIPVAKAWTNLQLRHYAVALYDRMGADTTIVAITQPWAKSPDDLHSAEYRAADMEAFRQELLDVLALTEPIDAPRHASIEACGYCSACAYCPVAVTRATELAVVKIGEITVHELEELGPQIELAKKVCEQWLKRMKYVAANFPDQLQVYCLDKLKERRSIPNAVLAVKMLRQNGVLTDDENAALMLCDLSIKSVEEHIRVVEKITKDGAELRAKDILGPLIVRTPMDRAIVNR